MFICEDEYRFAFLKDNNDLFFRESSQNIIPYIKMAIIPDGEKLPIEIITIAPKINSDLALLSMQKFMQNKGYNVSIVKSEIPLKY